MSIIVKRERQRYILFQIFIGNQKINIDKGTFLNAVWKSLWRYFGMKEAIKSGLWLLDFDNKNRNGVIRCTNFTKEKIICALTMIKNLKGHPIIISPIKSSGTLKKIRKIRKEISQPII